MDCADEVIDRIDDTQPSRSRTADEGNEYSHRRTLSELRLEIGSEEWNNDSWERQA